jgi:hypothetical protein
MGKSPKEFIQAMRTALEGGDFKTAQQLAFQGVEHYPDHEELKKFAYLLAPAMVILGNPSPEERSMYRAWLRSNHLKYRGRWVALSKGQLIADARNSDELKEQVGDTKGLVMISIG